MQFIFRIFPFTQKEFKELPWKPIIITLVASLALIGIRFYSGAHNFDNWSRLWHTLGLGTAADFIHHAVEDHPDAELWQLVYWALVSFAYYVLLPLAAIVFVFRESPAKYGLKFKGLFFGWKAYLLMASVILPVVVLVSFSPEFVHTYPFYRFRSPDKLFPIFFLGIFLPRIHGFGFKAPFKGVFYSGHDHSVLYDSFQQTAAGVYRFHFCRLNFGSHELPHRFGLAGRGLARSRSAYHGCTEFMASGYTPLILIPTLGLFLCCFDKILDTSLMLLSCISQVS